jgi:hypothetical protein
MPGVRRPSTSICFLRDDERLREAALARLASKKMKRIELSGEVGLPPYLVSNWLNGKRPYPSQWDIVRICRILNLKVELTVEIDYENI